MSKRKTTDDDGSTILSPMLARKALVSGNHTRVARTISIDRLPDESKRLHLHNPLRRMPSEDSPAKRAVQLLLQPSQSHHNTPPEHSFCLTPSECVRICDQVQPLFEQEPVLLSLQAPLKCFGDLHGQYADLMRLFDSYGSPHTDATVCDYLFLGDYVDRGANSLETIMLLLALKCQRPHSIFLVRGNHESPEVNARDGFLHECVQRLGGKADGIRVWKRLNQLFEWLPMGAVVNDVILCVHGGIGANLTSIEQIASLPRPLRMGGAHQDVMLDLLWSDPTKSDAVQGVHSNDERGSPVVCFGPDRVASFLRENKLRLIVRAHECVMDGFQRFAGGQLVTIFSATNYCNRWGNAGAILQIGKSLELTPLLIYPRQLDTEGGRVWLSRDAGADTLADMRPPTPPRDDADDDDDDDDGGGGGDDEEQLNPSRTSTEVRKERQLSTLDERSDESAGPEQSGSRARDETDSGDTLPSTEEVFEGTGTQSQ